MFKRIATVNSFTVAIALFLLLGGGVYAFAQLTQDVAATVTVQLKTPDGIEVYLDEALTQVAETIPFGDAEVDFFGTSSEPVTVPVWVQNQSNSAIELTIDDDFDLGNVEISGGGPPPVLLPGDVLPLVLALNFHEGSAGAFGFNVVFQTEGPVPVPAPDRLIVVLDPPSLESPLDCEVTGSGTVNYRPSAEFLIEADRFTGELVPMLATAWSLSQDGFTWNFQLQEGVPWHFGFGDFTASDVSHSMAYYTNDECRASYSDYFRNDPGAVVEIVDDHEVNMRMQTRPAVDFTYWLSAYRGVPMSSKAQWDLGCPNGEADYVQGYCAGGRDIVFAQPARTGPYQFVSFEEGVGWEYDAVDYDHYRVNPDFPEIEIRDVSEPATRLAIMLAREGHIASIDRALLQEVIDGGLEVVDSSSTALTAFAIFGGMYHDSSIAGSFVPTPWNATDGTGKMVRMAMNKAIDRDQINEAIYDGLGSKQWVATLAPDFPAGFNPEWEAKWDELYGYDPEAAKQLLADAGYPEGFSFTIPLFPLSGVPELPDMMEAISAMWESIGLDPTLEDWEFSRWREKYRGLDTSCCSYAFRGPAAPIDTRVHFYFSPERFFRAYTSDTITANRNLALGSLTQTEADILWQEVSDEIFFEVGAMPGWLLPASAVINPDVVSDYVFLGSNGGTYVSLEHVKAVP